MDPSRKRKIRLAVALGAAVLLAGALMYTSFSAGTRLGGGALPETTHSSSATSRARTAGIGLCGLRGLTFGPASVVAPARPPCWVPAIM